MLIYLALFLGLSAIAAFGVTYLVLRRTSYAPYSLLLSLISFQPLLIVAVTILGWRLPSPLTPSIVFAPVVAGSILTLFVVVRLHREIIPALGEAWKASCFILGVALAAMIFAAPVLSELAYIDWWNGEMVNYAYFAHGYLGLLPNASYLPGFEQSSAVRYGAELFLACLSLLSGKAPLMLINVVSILHKGSAIIAFGVGCDLVRRERQLLPVAAAAACVGFAFAAILEVNHQLAFFASQAVAGSFVLISLAVLQRGGLPAWRVRLFLAVHVLFVVITYAEAMPFLVIAAFFACVGAWQAGSRNLAVAIFSIFVVALLANPWLALSRFGYLWRLREVVAGFNVLGSPRDGLETYLATAMGFRFPFLESWIPPQMLLRGAIGLGLIALVGAFIVTARRLRSFLFLGIPLLVVLMHFSLGRSIQTSGSEFYKSYKTIAALSFYLYFALAFLIDALLRFRPRHWTQWLPVSLPLAGCGLLILGNSVVSVQAAAAIRQVPSVYRESEVDRALGPSGRGSRPVLFLINDNSAAFWDLMANYRGVPRKLLDPDQAKIIYHDNAPPVSEPAVFPPLGGDASENTERTWFEGRIIVSRIAAYLPQPAATDVRAALKALAPRLSLRQDDVALIVPAFRAIDGALVSAKVSAGNLAPATPPTIVGVAPKAWRGSKVTLHFTYASAAGEEAVDHLLININTPGQSAGSCFISYNRKADQLGLVQADAKSWEVGLLGAKKRLTNGQCVIDCENSWSSGSGQEFTLHIAFEFLPPFAGRKVIETTVADTAERVAGWEKVAEWVVP